MAVAAATLIGAAAVPDADASDLDALGGVAAAGAVDPQPTPRVVGGEPTTTREYPWQVALAEHQDLEAGEQSAFDRHFCGGSLVAPDIVITAAHCVYDTGPAAFPLAGCTIEGGYAFPPSEFSVIAGRTALSSTKGEEIDVEEIWYFVEGPDGKPVPEAQTSKGKSEPRYDCMSWTWDVVFLELEHGAKARTIKLAGRRERETWVPGSPTRVTGWGLTSDTGEKSDQLRQTLVPVVEDDYCSSGMGYGPQFNPETMLCAGPLEGGRDSCSFDSGGGLTAPIGNKGRRRLVGSVSFGFGPTCARPGKPGGYARLADRPIRPALRRGVRAVAGVDIVGRRRLP